jgi:hypothetical protein
MAEQAVGDVVVAECAPFGAAEKDTVVTCWAARQLC